VRVANLLTASLSLVVAGSALVEAARVNRPPTELSRTVNDASEPFSSQQTPQDVVLVLWLPSDLDEPNKEAPPPAQPTPTGQNRRRAGSRECPWFACPAVK
jgi:hypothetical protein